MAQGLPLAIAAIGLLAFTACQSEQNVARTDGDGTIKETSRAQMSKEPFYSETVEDQKCTLLTLEEVSEVTGIKADSIEEKLKGCLYSWDATAERSDGTIYLARVKVYDSIDKAKKRYSRRTANVSQADIKKAKEDSKRNPGAAFSAGLTQSMAERDVQHVVLPQLGSEAAISNDGTVQIRSGNLTIRFNGKTGGEDTIDAELAQKVGRKILANLANPHS